MAAMKGGEDNVNIEAVPNKPVDNIELFVAKNQIMTTVLFRVVVNHLF